MCETICNSYKKISALETPPAICPPMLLEGHEGQIVCQCGVLKYNSRNPAAHVLRQENT